jgi:muramidase (phage lysozyme)
MADNRSAFLDTIATSEGTIHLGDNGYNVLVGGQLFKSYATHPNIKVFIPRLGIWSTAAGRYQEKYSNYVAYSKLLYLKDFGHDSQDAIALQQIKEAGALPYIDAGNIDAAVNLCAHLWASFPGADYHQREQKLSFLIAAYTKAGGTLAGANVQMA